MPTNPLPWQKNQKKPKKPLGKPIEWDESELEELSHVTNADKKAAAALWRNEAPDRYKNLLEATEEKQ